MPELPEVESISRFISPLITHKTIKEIIILREKNFIGNPKDVINTQILSVSRHGKYLHLHLSNGMCISIHLRMSGQIFVTKNTKASFTKKIPRSGSYDLPNKHTRVIIIFTDSSALFYNDLRAFGYLKIESHPSNPKGMDVKNDPIDWKDLEKISKGSKKDIKTLLLDQDKIAGIGNIYACEILFHARISPFLISSLLKENQLHKLANSIQVIIELALTHKGTSMGDEMYVLPDNSSGNFQKYVSVYGRENLQCKNCETKIVRKKQNGRSTFFCPICQK